MHTIMTRPLSETERRRLAGYTKLDVGSWIYVVVLFGVAPFFLFGMVGRWLGGYISENGSAVGQWVGWTAGVLMFVYAAAVFFPYEHRLRKRAVQDEENGVVEEIHVVEARVIQIELISDHEPILAFDIGDNKVLFLQGQWLYDADTYGKVAPEGDPVDEFINGLPAPDSFPSSEFTVTRLPRTGMVLGIRVSGHYVAPYAEVDVLKRGYDFCDSEIFSGLLEEIGEVLAREHLSRGAR